MQSQSFFKIDAALEYSNMLWKNLVGLSVDKASISMGSLNLSEELGAG